MPSRASKKPKDRDINRRAYLTVMKLTGSLPEPPPEPDTRNPAAVALGKLGAAKGGRARAEKLSARKRREIARKAASARWSTRAHHGQP
jgi:hypothetical protein